MVTPSAYGHTKCHMATYLLPGVREGAELPFVDGDAPAPVQTVPGDACHGAAVPMIGAV